MGYSHCCWAVIYCAVIPGHQTKERPLAVGDDRCARGWRGAMVVSVSVDPGGAMPSTGARGKMVLTASVNLRKGSDQPAFGSKVSAPVGSTTVPIASAHLEIAGVGGACPDRPAGGSTDPARRPAGDRIAWPSVREARRRATCGSLAALRHLFICCSRVSRRQIRCLVAWVLAHGY